MQVYFGTYTQDREHGIYQFEFDPKTGALTERGGFGGVTHPSFLALHPDGTHLYAVAESGKDDGLTAFAIDAESGALSPVNTQTAAGRGACHVAVDGRGGTAVVSYYGSGSVASFPIQKDGSLGPVASLIQHEGSSVDPQRQTAPHAHSATFDPTGRYVIVADLGLDQLLVYRHDPETSELTPHDTPAFDLHPGAGPRHFTFHTNPWRFAYVINELDATLTALRWDAEAGTFLSVQTVSTLPAGYEGRKSTAEVVVHPDGKFLYGSNRGHDSLAVFSIDAESGELTPQGHVPAGDEEPRNFNLDPSGRWLICAHQNSDTAQVFAVDAATGGLTPVGEPVAVPKAVCVKLLRR
jgi:6-phosphogluconolactonase